MIFMTSMLKSFAGEKTEKTFNHRVVRSSTHTLSPVEQTKNGQNKNDKIRN